MTWTLLLHLELCYLKRELFVNLILLRCLANTGCTVKQINN